MKYGTKRLVEDRNFALSVTDHIENGENVVIKWQEKIFSKVSTKNSNQNINNDSLAERIPPLHNE